MKTVFVLFNSLNRHLLGAYGGTRFPTPNFDRLAARSRRFDRHYVGSLPCMPARRDMLTGRLSFLHRSWGPLEPFDNAFPELLAQAGIYSHLVTDHYHYWEDGGATYHNRYDSYEFVRGQEGDRWKAMVQPQWERLRELYHANQFSTERRNQQGPGHHQPRVHPRRKGFSVRAMLRARLRLPRPQPRRGRLAAADWKPSTRTSHFMRRPASSSHSTPAGPARFATGRATVASMNFPPECEELRANYYAVVALCDSLLGQLLDYFDCARSVARHRADRHHRSRLSARRARFLGQEPHEPLRGDRAHPAVRARSAAAVTGRADRRADPIDRPGADASSICSAWRRHRKCKGIRSLVRHAAAPPGRGAVRLFRRRGQRDRRPPHLSSLPAGSAHAGDLPIHPDADAYRVALPAGGAVAPQRSARRSRSPRAPDC